MTHIYRCTIELHDSLYYATREIGRLYETEPVLHNYALCYALGLVDSDRYSTRVSEEHGYRYFCPEQVPKYEAHLMPLNQQGIYVTPARAVNHAAVLHTWKYANNNYHVEMEKTQKNIPSFGRTKEIAAESQFECFVITSKTLQFSKWIRLGKWMSKAAVSLSEPLEFTNDTGDFVCEHPLNPLDVMFTHQVVSYDTLNMPPVSLIRNVRILKGAHYRVKMGKETLTLPANMQYHFGGG
ncbi:type I-D CRISPR-associated protein Cas5/Csc1 [Alkalinema sp. FACHB-956]|uniref:type I-D CRISPR-associated protein Cas5/Csc1 n=1 Tax=Alkalinema sp. FACHB-956 TaxID=2692768 RepID=UPI001687427C|nr:type I-D CRISPR-associated protein Cas5/Csc1 [Alkalinema sp. FACHB-956]MBD2330134.1 type I-D CRISPR-associated protein Cas5/Csc1 [Alkalinema sp. FACHB-956]